MAILVFNGERIEIHPGESILSAARRSGQGAKEIASSCPGVGRCRECLVRITRGYDGLTPWTESEAFLKSQADAGGEVFRLACQAEIASDDAVVEVETFKRKLDIATSGRFVLDRIDPWLEHRGCEVVCDGKVLMEYGRPIHGLAIDVGTTTVVLHLVELETGKTVAVRAFENPQRFGGSDVMHRISYDLACPGQLHRTIIGHVNSVLQTLAIDSETIMAVTVAANPTMRDLFFGIDVQGIGQSPFMSLTQLEMLAGTRKSTSLRATGEQLGLKVNPLAQVYGLPLISNHVGSDMSAVLATIPITSHANPFVVIDIGTNTEVVVGTRDRLVAASCAAGPAFEGGRVSCGMAASEGAITSLRRRDGTWTIRSIGSAPARGICGSGLVDILAELHASGEIDDLGRFSGGVTGATVNEEPPVRFSSSDASELVQTKAAIGLGQAVLLRRFGIRPDEVDRYYLAGAFANKLDFERAVRIGLLLPVPAERVCRIGNAAIEGAKAALLDRHCRDEVETIVKGIEHVELEKEPDFFDLFVEMTHLRPIDQCV